MILAAAAVFGINATDEELTELARNAMSVPPAPPTSSSNGYTDFLALDEISIDTRLKKSCGPEPGRCLKFASDNPELVQLSARDDEFAARYLAMRSKAEFVDLHEDTGPDGRIPHYGYLIWGQGRSLTYAASLANRGRLETAVTELEAENAFHRRVATGARSLITKMVGLSTLQRDAFFASELARIPGKQATAVLGRLLAVVRPLAEVEIDVRKSHEIERAQRISWMQTRRYVRLSDDYYRFFKESFELELSRPWWDPIAPYLYRPHQSINRYVTQTEILHGVAELPATEYATGAAAAYEKARALSPRGLASIFVNPVGNRHPYLSVAPGGLVNKEGYTAYFARARATQAIYTMVALQIRLRDAGITRPSAVEHAQEGPLFRAHPDPFTGKPMRFDPNTRTIGFKSPVVMGGTSPSLYERYGRVAVEVAIAP